MISREEAEHDLEKFGKAGRTIEKIYDSIGSCGDCKHFQEADGLRYCYLLDEYDMEYCSRFEKSN